MISMYTITDMIYINMVVLTLPVAHTNASPSIAIPLISIYSHQLFS